MSLDDQRQVIARRAKLLGIERGLTVSEIVADAGVSATRYDLRARRDGSRLDAMLRAGDHVVIAKLDRAFRSQRDALTTLEAWERRGVTVHLLDISVETNTPTGRLFIGILAAIAQWEAARIGERIRDAKRAMRSKGKPTNGRAPLGYRIVRGKLVIDAIERKRATMVAQLRRRGMLWREIAESLNSRGVKRPKRNFDQVHTVWNPQACQRLYLAHQAKFAR